MSPAAFSFNQNLSLFSPEFHLSDVQLEHFRDFYLNLVEWNRVMNLTSITSEEDVYAKHFLDSLSILCCVSRETFSNGCSVIDIGTGAGFPGLPLAIAFPEARFTLVDSLNKRIRFLEETIEKIQIHNVELIHSRAEDLGRDIIYRDSYDLAVSRAVASLNVLDEYCLPLVKTGGSFVAFKSEKVEEELPYGKSAALKLGGEFREIRSFTLPDTEYRRTLVVFKKRRNTPSKYPRKAGMPAKKPLN